MGKPRSLWSPVCLIFVCIVTFAVILRYCFFDARDPSKCGALLNEGVWLDPQRDNHTTPREWQPPGCLVHKYKSADISACLANRRVVFVGDSTIRQIFWAVARKLDPAVDESTAEKHADIALERGQVRLEFVWDPFLNSSRVHDELPAFDALGRGGARVEPARPALMLVGTGLWYARFENINGLKMWKDHIDPVVQHMGGHGRTTDMTHQDLLLLAPVPVPVWNKLSQDRREAITPTEVGFMNSYLQQLSDLQGIPVVWAFNSMPKSRPQCYEASGIHLEKSIVDLEAEILLNLRCNAELPPRYPYDKTCCNKYEPPNFQQWAGLFFVLAGLPALLYMRNRDALRSYRAASTFYDSDDELAPAASERWWVPSNRVISALVVLGLAVVYCFYADRTQVFNKSAKHYTTSGFVLLSLIPLVLGFATFRRISTTGTGGPADQPFLARDQTDEWKGWMQAAILVYHYTGASKIAWIYGFIRITVASYLFMTGFGHTVFFLKKGDYSFKRVAGVLIRLNLLSCVLPYVMKTEYIFYYFAPLSSFWFLVVYATMRAGAKYNASTRFVVAKVVASAAVVTAFTRVPGVLEAVFAVPHALAFTNWSVSEWRFRVFLDMWIVYVGMLVALAFVKLSSPTATAVASRLPRLRRWALVGAAVALPAFFAFEASRPDKFAYNAWHPYVSWIPILAFAWLRNATPRLRNAYSGAWAWLGRCSLETFTLQFHIWLAADTRGLLDLGIFGPYARFENFCVATVVFLYVSWRVADATGVLTQWIMGVPEKKKAAAGAAAAPPPSLPPADVERADAKAAAAEDEAVPLADIASSSRTNSLNVVDAGAPPTKEARLGAAWADLRVRCAALLLAMWLLNVTYSP